MLKLKHKADKQMQKAKKLIVQTKCNDARKLTMQQMMADESTVHDEDGQGGDDNDNEDYDEYQHGDINDTYADFDEGEDDDSDPSETREEYDSEDEGQQAQQRMAQQRFDSQRKSRFSPKGSH